MHLMINDDTSEASPAHDPVQTPRGLNVYLALRLIQYPEDERHPFTANMTVLKINNLEENVHCVLR